MGGGLRSGFRAGRASMVPGMPGMLRERLQQLRVLDDRVPRRVGLPDGATGRFVATLAIQPRLVDQLRQALGEEVDEHPHRRQHAAARGEHRSEEHTYELQSLMRTSYAVFCLKKKKDII